MQELSRMQDRTDQADRVPALEYLECLGDLSSELKQAMRFLGENALRSFEESVSKQLALCSRLSGLAAVHPLRRRPEPSTGEASAHNDLARRVEEAQAHLIQLNRNYSALLTHTGRTMQMFARLSQGYAGYTSNGCAPPPEPVRTWSAQT